MKKTKKISKRNLPERTKPVKHKPTRRGEQIILVQGTYGAMHTKDHRHIEQRYTVKKEVSKDGTITMTMKPFEKMQARRKELINNLVGVLAEKLDNKALMEDILQDVGIESLENLHKSIKRGAKVTSKPGCFYLEIKDPYKKKPYKLGIRR